MIAVIIIEHLIPFSAIFFKIPISMFLKLKKYPSPNIIIIPFDIANVLLYLKIAFI